MELASTMIDGKRETLGELLHDAAHLLRTVIDREAIPHNLTRAQWLALVLLDSESGLTQADLAERLELGNPAVGRLVDRLEERGFVERRGDASDRRIRRVYIKDEARPVLAELEQVAQEVRVQALQGISGEEHMLLVSLLRTVKKNLRSAHQRMGLLAIGLGQIEGVIPFLAQV